MTTDTPTPQSTEGMTPTEKMIEEDKMKSKLEKDLDRLRVAVRNETLQELLDEAPTGDDFQASGFEDRSAYERGISDFKQIIKGKLK